MLSSRRRVAGWAALVLVVGVIVSPALGRADGGSPAFSNRMLAQLSQAPAIRYWMAHPNLAPASYRTRLQAAVRTVAAARAAGPMKGGPPSAAFNRDGVGFPQNEESVTVCRSDPDVVLEGTNDYRGLLDPAQNFTGWDISTNGGKSVAKEGLVPPLDFGAGTMIPSGGDPVMASDGTCNLYNAGLNYDPTNLFPSGIGVYKTDPATLTGCPGGVDPTCWPTGIVVAKAPDSTHFLDKEWIDVGQSGAAGEVVWVSWSDFLTPDPTNPGAFTAQIWASRCDAALTACTAPELISGTDQDVQFSYVTIGPDGRTYLSWAEIQGELTAQPETFIIKMRIAPAGSTDFGPTMIVANETLPIGFDNNLHANSFRVATIPKSTVQMVNGKPRIFVTWEDCTSRPLGVCEEPKVLLKYSDDDGVTWSPRKVLSVGGDNYFPTLSAGGSRLAVAWYTNRFDPVFHNRQDVELVTVDPKTLKVVNRQRVTKMSNETEADPLLGAFFIGDYFQVFANAGKAYVAYNANYRSVKLMGNQGSPVPQQDNYLAVREL